MREWMNVQGRVVRCGVEALETKERDRVYRTNLEYEYIVDGNRYLNREVYRSGQQEWVTPTPAQQRRVVARFPAGTPVEVAFDPENPTRAKLVIEQGNPLGRVFGGLLGR